MGMSQEPCILLKDLVGPTELLWLRRNVLASKTVEGGESLITVFVFLFVAFSTKPTISYRRKANFFSGLDHEV